MLRDGHGNTPHPASGPLKGVRVVEFAGLGPGPFACMLLSDMGADVVTIDRPGKTLGEVTNIVGRGRSVIQADLKRADERDRVLDLLARADVLVEGFRPGVMERLGLGPDVVAARNPRLVYGRMTGWGQEGPNAHMAGHDINYIALAGPLHAIGQAGGPPTPPLNLVGDYGGGSLYLALGIVAALFESRQSGKGQVVDAAITDGAFSMMTQFVSEALRGTFGPQRGANRLDGGVPYYAVYETADGEHMAVGAIEPKFFAILCERLNLKDGLREAQNDRSRWPELRQEFERIFRTRTRAEWTEVFEGSDACASPVLSLADAMAHPQQAARRAVVEIEGVRQPAPAPRFSRTSAAIQGPAPKAAISVEQVLERWVAG